MQIGLSLSHTPVITTYGSDFNYPLGEITASFGRLTRILVNGDLIDNDFYIYDNATIVPVPLLSAVILGSIGLGFAGRKLRKYKEL